MTMPRTKFILPGSRRTELYRQAARARTLGRPAKPVPPKDLGEVFSLGEGEMDDLLRRAFEHYNLDPANPSNWRTLLELYVWTEFYSPTPRKPGRKKTPAPEPNAELSDDLPIEEWVRRRNQQLAAKSD
jgi:hypothetical protein